jgi:muramoyltetrapeptide carboxypeptidase LdcA involved in peptidoglycan recycling
MKYPSFLKKGETIGIPAPSDGADDELKIKKYKNAQKRFEDWGYKIERSKNLYKSIRGRSASDKERAKEINDLFDSKDIDLILCATGGEFLVEMLPYVNFNKIVNNPKFICGFSDPTGLLYPITTKYDVATIYGANFSPFGALTLHKSHEDFMNIITGSSLEEEGYPLYEEERLEKITGLEGYNLTEKVVYKTLDNKDVNVKGRIISGCFDIIAELSGTKYDGIKEFNEKYKNDGIIWCFDNCELSMEEVIRVLWKLNELDYFKYAKAIIFGRFGYEHSNKDYDVKTCLKDSVISKLNIPIIYDADISHKPSSLTIINGSIANIELRNNKFKIKFELK